MTFKQLMKAKGFTIQSFATAAGLSMSTAAELNVGKLRNMRVETARAAAQALGVSLDELLSVISEKTS